MRNPRKNLGDYATIIDDLHLYDGDKQKMYDDIRRSGAEEAAPKHWLESGIVVLAASAIVNGGIKLWKKHRRKKQEAKEAELKARYNAMFASDAPETDSDDESVENERDVADTE